MPTAQDVADYFLANKDQDELLTNMKLQKLLYYAQGFHLAIYDRALFPEQIRAWAHGPVVPAVWRGYREYGSNPIPVPSVVALDEIEDEQAALLDEIHSVYGQFSAWRLRELTHGEPPWRETETSGVITHDSLRRYFKTRLK